MPGLNFFRSFYPGKAVYYTGYFAAALFVLSFFIPLFFSFAVVILVVIVVAVLFDTFFLYQIKEGITAERFLPERLSNGDENNITLEFSNRYSFIVRGMVVEELPFQFQERSWQRRLEIQRDEMTVLHYTLKPVTRGVYGFGYINVYVNGPLGVVQRRYRCGEPATVPVYPSYIQMRRYQLAAIGNKLHDAGTKQLRKLGHSSEFEQIKEYVRGDDYRTVNWKATARKADLMANAFTDERSQPIYCVINKGRAMKLPFDGMTLLDYSINATLALLNVALHKGDKAGLITFAQQVDTFITADKKTTQRNVLLEALYSQQTHFSEPDYETLFAAVRNKITQRSLLVLFTNFESIESLERQLPFLKKVAHYHLLVVVFFENTELKTLMENEAETIEDIYIKTIAEKYQHEKRLMVKALHQQGIIAVLTTPQQLTVNTLNKYLELKKRQSI